jgi:hypothetical protein
LWQLNDFFLPQDHIQEVLNKWESIDDEIWAKIIVLGKSYTNTPIGLLSLQYLWFLPSKQPEETNIIFNFNEMHGFFYESRATLSATGAVLILNHS